MTVPLISCVVPVYNGEVFLSEALDSILAQDHRPIEIVVVDDGSTDNTAKLVAEYGAEVRYLWQENSGPVVARNLGISSSRGEFVSFLDADDLMAGNKLSRQWSAMADRPEIDYVVCYIQNFWVDELAEERESYRDHPRAAPIPGYTTAGLLARRDAFDRVGLFDPDVQHSDSTDWFLRANTKGLRGELLDEVLVRRRIHPGSRSRRWRQRSTDEFLRLAKRSADRQRRAGDITRAEPETR